VGKVGGGAGNRQAIFIGNRTAEKKEARGNSKNRTVAEENEEATWRYKKWNRRACKAEWDSKEKKPKRGLNRDLLKNYTQDVERGRTLSH